MRKSGLRKALGKAKCEVVDRWPYKLLEHRAARLREQWRPWLHTLGPIDAVPDSTAEIHMLCGKEHLDMGIWASWSILRYLGGIPLHVHSDGTLDDEDVRLWRGVIPRMSPISREERQEKVAASISRKYPNLYEWWTKDWCGMHVVDMHLFGGGGKRIVMDADVLCFKEPLELLEAIADPQPAYRWNRDLQSSYSAETARLNAITGLKIPEKLNAGFQLTPRFGEREFEHLERMIGLLKKEGGVDPNHVWSSQTYCAMAATLFPDAEALSDPYAVKLGRTAVDAVVRHFVGVPRVRPRYFTEGVARLLRGLDVPV